MEQTENQIHVVVETGRCYIDKREAEKNTFIHFNWYREKCESYLQHNAMQRNTHMDMRTEKMVCVHIYYLPKRHAFVQMIMLNFIGLIIMTQTRMIYKVHFFIGSWKRE